MCYQEKYQLLRKIKKDVQFWLGIINTLKLHRQDESHLIFIKKIEKSF